VCAPATFENHISKSLPTVLNPVLELVRGLYNIQPHQRGCAATIGNFDGIHVGHAALIDAVATQARKLQTRACVISFEPLPMEYFATPENVPPRLTWLREKWHALGDQRADQLLLLRFNRQLATTTPADFIQQVLVDGLAVRYLLVGDDFRFGLRREGDINLLREAGQKHNFTVEQADTIEHTGERVSSTRIRTLLKAGDLSSAAALLGRPYALQGHVVHGAKLGRTIGFPTANLAMEGKNPPLRGVFAVRATVDDEQNPINGIANLGEKPTVDGRRLSLEIHLLDFNSDLYGKRLRVSFHHKVRDEMKFDSIDALKRAIADDEAKARDWFANTTD
jgi:riboflavin kinase/FMN adenylyltransferase